MSENNINPDTISDKELEAASGGARPQINVEGAKKDEVKVINPKTPTDVTVSGTNDGVMIFK